MCIQVYKNAIKKEVEKVYDLAGEKLIREQEKLVKILEKIFEKWYKIVLQELKSNEEIKMNDILNLLNSSEIKKYADEDDLEKVSKKLEKGFKIGAENLEYSFSLNPKINISFGLSDEKAIEYAKEKGAKLISGVDDYTKKRISKIVTKGVENGLGYNSIAKEIKKDYAFSSYRSNLIASHELGNAYLSGKDEQFKKYREDFGVDGFKQWVSHRDIKTSEGCLINDHQGRIPYSEDFESGHSGPTRFPGCRCNIVYNIFNPDDVRLDNENASASDSAQAKIPKDTGFNPGIKPINYDKYSTGIIPASFYNEVGEQITYIDEGVKAYYSPSNGIINLARKGKNDFWLKQSEVHELGHFFFEKKVFKNEELLNNFIEIFNISKEELDEKIKDPLFLKIVTQKYRVDSSQIIKENFDKIKKLKKYSIGIIEEKYIYKGKIITDKFLEENDLFGFEVGAFLDIVGALNKQEKYGLGHNTKYYDSEIVINDITKKQLHEYFAHLNEVFFMDNLILSELMPKTYESMKKFYKNNGLKF